MDFTMFLLKKKYLKFNTALFLVIFADIFTLTLAKDLKLLILHNSDLHSRFEQTSKSSGTCMAKKSHLCIGGFARTAHIIREARRNATSGNGPKVLYLNAGDTYTGTVWYSVHRWKIVAEFLNVLNPDAMSFGNHEFDHDIKGVVPFVEAIKFPLVAANLDYTGAPEIAAQNIPKSTIVEIDGRKIGVIGYLTVDTVHISSPTGIKFIPEVVAINEEAKNLVNKGVNIIIAVGHSGFKMDKEIAKNCPEVDVVVGGHTNTFLYNGPPPDDEKPEGPYPTVITQKSGKKVPVVQAYAYTKYMGFLNVNFNDRGDLTFFKGQPLLVENGIPQDEDVLKLLEKYRPEVTALNSQVVGKSKVFLDARHCRSKECNLGNLLADSMVGYRMSVYAGNHWTDAPIAFINGGSIRNSINVSLFGGNITRAEILSCMPFDNQIISCGLKGADLWKTLETSVRSNGETSKGEFLQFSGLFVEYDVSKPVGKRVVSVQVRCSECEIPKYEDIDLKKTYRVITTNFLMKGGDAYDVLKNKGFDRQVDDLNDVEILVWFLKQYSPVYPEMQGRIKFVKKQCGCQGSGDGKPKKRSDSEDNAAIATVSHIMSILPISVIALLLF